MTDYHESKIVPLIGVADGVNRTFDTPTAFVSGTIKVFFNGVEYHGADDRKGWTEVTDSRILMDEAPRANDYLEAFYQELSTVPGIGNVVGTPFDPDGVLP